MMLKDFEKGGFPIGRLSPVIVLAPGRGVCVAYDSFTLKSLIGQVPPKLLIGVWPGKHTTGLFFLDPSSYGKIAPPESDKDIDSATEIIVHYIGEAFDRIEYAPYSKEGEMVTVVTKSEETFDYITKTGRKYRAVRE